MKENLKGRNLKGMNKKIYIHMKTDNQKGDNLKGLAGRHDYGICASITASYC